MWKLVVAIVLLLAGSAALASAQSSPRLTPARSASVGESAGFVTVSVSLPRAARRATRVRYATRPGTASTADFVARSGTLTIRRRARRATVRIGLRADTLAEADETFTVRFSRPSGARLGSRRATTVTIRDDDVQPQPQAPSPTPSPTPTPTPTPSPEPGGSIVVSVDDLIFTEPAAPGATAAHGAVARLNRAALVPVTVQYSLIAIGDTTTAADVDLAGGTLTFAPGETSQPIPGNVKGDALDESQESVRIVLADASGADIISPDAFLDISDDPADLPPALSIGDVTVAEASTTVMVPVTLSAASGRRVTVAYATANDSAVAPGDYTAASGTLPFQPGQTAASIPVTINDDVPPDSPETFTVTLSQPGNATLADEDATATVTITD